MKSHAPAGVQLHKSASKVAGGKYKANPSKSFSQKPRVNGRTALERRLCPDPDAFTACLVRATAKMWRAKLRCTPTTEGAE